MNSQTENYIISSHNDRAWATVEEESNQRLCYHSQKRLKDLLKIASLDK